MVDVCMPSKVEWRILPLERMNGQVKMRSQKKVPKLAKTTEYDVGTSYLKGWVRGRNETKVPFFGCVSFDESVWDYLS